MKLNIFLISLILVVSSCSKKSGSDSGSWSTGTETVTGRTVITPSATISDPSLMYTNNKTVYYEIKYENADQITLSPSDVKLIKTGSANSLIKINDVDDQSKRIELYGLTGDGTITINVKAGTAKNIVANKSVGELVPTKSIVVDNTPPKMSIDSVSLVPESKSFTYNIKCSDGEISFKGDKEDTEETIERYTLNTEGTASADFKSESNGATGKLLIEKIAGNGKLSASITGSVCKDKAGNVSQKLTGNNVEVKSDYTPVAIKAYGARTCALLSNGAIKCWGENFDGALGLEHDKNVGSKPSSMGFNLPYLSISSTTKAQQISVGKHACALMEDSSVKCWGSNYYGELGQGHRHSQGNDPEEMGDNLVAVNLGTGKTALQVVSGSSHSCAILNDNTVKCWGLNSSGQLGLGHVKNIGGRSSEMGDNLKKVDLGKGRKAVHLSAASSTTCALLDDFNIKCWGANSNGQLGQGHSDRIGDGPSEMGNKLKPINLGKGITAKTVYALPGFVCATLDNDALKCWGKNNRGQLGQGHVNNIGDGIGEMGDKLAPVNLGTNLHAKSVAGNAGNTCVVLSDSTVKCWGYRYSSMISPISDDRENRGDDAGEMGDNLPIINLGSGKQIDKLAVGDTYACALLKTGKVKCWGSNKLGQLGIESTKDIGYGMMGDQMKETKVDAFRLKLLN